MTLLVVSFLAGILTVAAPCVLPLLPVIVGGSVMGAARDQKEKQWLRPLVIAGSLAVAVVVFSLAIKGTTALLGVPQAVWQWLSGVIVLSLGVHYLRPQLWEKLGAKVGFTNSSAMALSKAGKTHGWAGSVLLGAALGPVFSSCSPTYALIIATVLPVSFGLGVLYLAAYAVGMSMTLLLIAYLGQAFAVRLRWLADPNGWLRRVIGVLFVLVGLAVVLGFDKDVQTFVLERGWYDPISGLERRLH